MINLQFNNYGEMEAFFSQIFNRTTSAEQQPAYQAPQPTQQPVYQTVPVQQPTQAPVYQAPQPTQPPTYTTGVPTTAPEYTLDQLARAAAPLMDAGKGEQLRGLLQQFGVPTLSQLPTQMYGQYANALRGLGAKL